MGLSGKLGSNGFMYATPLPMMVCLGVNDVLFSHKVKDTTPVFPGSICILFLSVFHYDLTNCSYLSFTLTTTMIVRTYYFEPTIKRAKDSLYNS